MSKTMINLSHLRDLTIKYGEDWGYAHVCRVLHLIGEIGAGMAYDENITLYAAHLHDWGAFPHFQLPNVEHSLRSKQVAEEQILPFTLLGPAARQNVLEAISRHDYRDIHPAGTLEALLLREADMLDMLGTLGVMREFAWGSNGLKASYSRALARRDGIAGRLTLPRSISMAEERLARMDRLFAELMEESFGHL